MSRAEFVTTIRGQHDPRDAIDVARREAEREGFVFVELARQPHRGVIPGTWVVALTVTREAKR